MSRSYRRPYGTCVRYRTAKWDKQQASRGVRRRVNRWVDVQLREDGEFDLVPHFRECHHNDVYDWSRDGSQRLQTPDHRDWSNYMKAVQGIGRGLEPYYDPGWYARHYREWPPAWYMESLRK